MLSIGGADMRDRKRWWARIHHQPNEEHRSIMCCYRKISAFEQISIGMEIVFIAGVVVLSWNESILKWKPRNSGKKWNGTDEKLLASMCEKRRNASTERETKHQKKITTHTRVNFVCRTISKRHNRKYWFHKHNWIGKLKNDRFINNPIFFLTLLFFVSNHMCYCLYSSEKSKEMVDFVFPCLIRSMVHIWRREKKAFFRAVNAMQGDYDPCEISVWPANSIRIVI